MAERLADGSHIVGRAYLVILNGEQDKTALGLHEERLLVWIKYMNDYDQPH